MYRMMHSVTIILVAGVLGVNVVVAVLLVRRRVCACTRVCIFICTHAHTQEGFMSSMQAAEEAQRVATEIHEHHRAAAALDPLLATLANFKSPQHLSMQLELLFTLFDRDDGGAVDFGELQTGLRKLGYSPSIRFSAEDWEAFTLNGALCNGDNELAQPAFDAAMRFQLSMYSQRLVANKMQQHISAESEHAPMLFALKMVVMPPRPTRPHALLCLALSLAPSSSIHLSVTRALARARTRSHFSHSQTHTHIHSLTQVMMHVLSIEQLTSADMPKDLLQLRSADSSSGKRRTSEGGGASRGGNASAAEAAQMTEQVRTLKEEVAQLKKMMEEEHVRSAREREEAAAERRLAAQERARTRADSLLMQRFCRLSFPEEWLEASRESTRHQTRDIPEPTGGELRGRMSETMQVLVNDGVEQRVMEWSKRLSAREGGEPDTLGDFIHSKEEAGQRLPSSENGVIIATPPQNEINGARETALGGEADEAAPAESKSDDFDAGSSRGQKCKSRHSQEISIADGAQHEAVSSSTLQASFKSQDEAASSSTSSSVSFKPPSGDRRSKFMPMPTH